MRSNDWVPRGTSAMAGISKLCHVNVALAPNHFALPGQTSILYNPRRKAEKNEIEEQLRGPPYTSPVTKTGLILRVGLIGTVILCHKRSSFHMMRPGSCIFSTLAYMYALKHQCRARKACIMSLLPMPHWRFHSLSCSYSHRTPNCTGERIGKGQKLLGLNKGRKP